MCSYSLRIGFSTCDVVGWLIESFLAHISDPTASLIIISHTKQSLRTRFALKVHGTNAGIQLATLSYQTLCNLHEKPRSIIPVRR